MPHCLSAGKVPSNSISTPSDSALPAIPSPSRVNRTGGKAYNISSSFFTGRFETTELQPGATEIFELQIGRKRRSTKKSRTIKVIGTSKSDPSKVDIVKEGLKIKRLRR